MRCKLNITSETERAIPAAVKVQATGFAAPPLVSKRNTTTPLASRMRSGCSQHAAMRLPE
jgi:hypothetical protein